MEFESSVGDLATVIGVEKRRATAIKNEVQKAWQFLLTKYT